METMEAERSTPQPQQPIIHLADSDSAVPSRGETLTPAPTSPRGGSDEAIPKPGDAPAEATDVAPTDASAPGSGEGVESSEAVDVEQPVGDGGDSGHVGDKDELPGLPALPTDDLDFGEAADKTDTTKTVDDELAPLPDELDFDAPLPALSPPPPLPEDDELAIVPREEPEPAPEPPAEPEPEPLTAVEEEEGHVDDGGKAPNNEESADFYAMIQHLADDLEGENEGGDEAQNEGQTDGDVGPLEDEAQAPEHEVAEPVGNEAMDIDEPQADVRERSPSPTSPLTPLSPFPELPNDLPLESDIAALPEPISSALAPELQPYPPESSSAALQRARTMSVGSEPHVASTRRRKGKSPSVSEDRDELHSSDGGERRERYKRQKGLDGKLIRRSNRPRKRLDKQLQIERHGDKPPEKVAPRAKTLSDQRLKAMVRGKTREVQLAPCIRQRYGKWGKCTQCVSKIGGDSCRFRNYRIFPLDPETGDITGAGWFESTKLEGPMTMMPNRWNVDLTEEHITRTEKTVAPLLVELISREMRHVIKNDALHRPVDTAQHRSVCDFCSSTIFAGFWFCTKCGRDYCIECERYFSDSSDSITTSPWPVPNATRPRLHRCTRGDEPLPLTGKPIKTPGKPKQVMHFRSDLKAASRFSADELRSDFMALINFVLEPGASDMDVEARVASLGLGDDEGDLADAVRGYFNNASPTLPHSKSPLSETDIQALYDASEHISHPEDPTGLKSLPFMYIEGDRLDGVEGTFDQLWSRGEPLVVYNLLKRLKKQWTPDNFLRRFGAEQCYVVDCQSDKVEMTSVGAFFLLFKELGGEAKMPQARSARSSPAVTTPSTPNGVEGAAIATESGTTTAATHDTTHEHMDVDGRPTANGGTPGPGTTAGQVPQPAAAEAANGNGTASPALLATGPTTASQPPAGVVGGGRPILPAPTPGGGRDGSAPPGSRSSSYDISISEQVRWMNSMAPGYHKLKSAKRIYKLKDWPSTDDFASAYPDLYRDFSDALPAPDFSQRVGVLNLYSHFPPGPTRPDIGPKMYNAFAGREDPGGFGSTRLHMDVADAVNIMLYASKMPDGSEGCAVWDLFRPEDADKIRTFLRAKFPKVKMTDPIHSQHFYLNSQLRAELYAEYGVVPFRVYQYPGQAIFVPAGCAHQVCNLSNCMKIALDFVSPHNVVRCQKLLQDFRRENFERVWKDDVLQLYNVMWYAWTNVRGIREQRKRQAAALQRMQSERAAALARLREGEVLPPLRAPPHTYPPQHPYYPTHPQAHPHAHLPIRVEARPHLLHPATSSVRDDPARAVHSPPPTMAGASQLDSRPKPADRPVVTEGGARLENGSRDATPRQATPTAPTLAAAESAQDTPAVASSTPPASERDAQPSPSLAPNLAADASSTSTSGVITEDARPTSTAEDTTADARPASSPLATGTESKDAPKDDAEKEPATSGATAQEPTPDDSDKHPASTSAIGPTAPPNGETPAQEPTSSRPDQVPASDATPTPPPPSPRQTLARRLLDAALERVPQPPLLGDQEFEKQASAPAPTPPRHQSYPRDEPVRYTEAIRLGHIESEHALQVLASDLGNGGDEQMFDS